MVSLLGAIVALALAIILILKKVPPVYGMLIGALVGGISITETVVMMISGAQGITTAVLRIIAAGILAGVLIESGAAHSIAETIVKKIGESRALLALILATLILTCVGVFIDVAVITVAPIALALATRINISRVAILLAMVGGGKAGNIISPNPNTIAAADAFNLPLTSVMMAGIFPAILGVFFTYFLAKKLINKGSVVNHNELISHQQIALPHFLSSISGPVAAIGLLMLRPLFGITIDPLIALPLGGLVGAVAMGKTKFINKYAINGLSRMAPVAIMLLGTGALAGIIANSELKTYLLIV